jgi:hypothetical protein
MACDVWTINPQPMGAFYDFTNADYVDEHGIPRIRSKDCPIHGQKQWHRLSSSEQVACDELKDVRLNRNQCNENHLFSSPISDSCPIKCYKQNREKDIPLVHNQENISENKNGGFSQDGFESQKIDHNSRTLKSDVSKRDCVHPSSSCSATDHSKSKNKKFRDEDVFLQAQGHKPCAQNSYHKYHISKKHALCDVGRSTNENNNAVDSFCNEKASGQQQMFSDNSDIHIFSSYKHYKCACQKSQVSYYASFPEKLVERVGAGFGKIKTQIIEGAREEL